MSITSVIRPEHRHNTPANTIRRVALEVGAPVESTVSEENLRIPIFHTPQAQVLLKDLAALLNYPLSYQLIGKLVKGGLPKSSIKRTDESLLDELLFHQLVDNKLVHYYVSLEALLLVVRNQEVLYSTSETEGEPRCSFNSGDSDDKILVLQVFPQYGHVRASLPLTHATFNTLNKVTKLNFYKLHNQQRRFLGQSLSTSERELLYRENESDVEILEDDDDDDEENDEPTRPGRKPIGKLKKNITNVDPNSIDITENMLPGQGLIQEFNVNHVCKVPNYYITTNHMNAAQTLALQSNKKPGPGLFNESVKLSRSIQQLVYNSDNDAYHQSKYYYTKSYRGPGSGNYKDAALVNRINRIHTVSSVSQIPGGCHKSVLHTKRPLRKRHNSSIKGLIHDYFLKDNLDATLDEQRRHVEDYHNLEILHNNIQFNLLLNTYREISGETWNAYYHFKLIDFEQLKEVQRIKAKEAKKKELVTEHHKRQEELGVSIPPSAELTELYKPELVDRFTLPTTYPEIVHGLPLELRDESTDSPAVKRPVYILATSSEYANSEYLNKVEVVKLPNANAVGWDNLRKYKATI